MKLKVGDIVKCNCKRDKCYSQLGFVEEIIRESNPNDKSLFGQGKYSIYGFQPAYFSSSPKYDGDYYYGDHLESDLQPTGETVKLGQLMILKEKLHGGFKDDIDIVVRNFGRESGRNK